MREIGLIDIDENAQTLRYNLAENRYTLHNYSVHLDEGKRYRQIPPANDNFNYVPVGSGNLSYTDHDDSSKIASYTVLQREGTERVFIVETDYFLDRFIQR